MEDYQFPKHMKRLIRILESFTKRPIYEMSPEEIDRLSTASIPNNWITRQLLDKKADHIVRKTLRIPTAEVLSQPISTPRWNIPTIRTGSFVLTSP